MPDDARNDDLPADSHAAETAESKPSDEGQGFSSIEKVVGVAAAYKHPLISSVAASAMLRNETDPARREQLSTLRKGSLTWLAISAGLAVVLLVIVLITVSSGENSCKGGPDKLDALNITYQSDGGNQWTATYPCYGGGSTTVPIARDKVPGQG